MALIDSALTKKITDHKLICIAIARTINLRSGGAIIAPWQVDDLDDDWINAFMSRTPDTIQEHDKRLTSAREMFYSKHLPRAKAH